VLKKRQLGDDVGTVRRLVWVGESYRDFAGQAGHARLRRLAEEAGRERARAAARAATARRLGSGTIEAKLVTNGRSAKRFGPYLYARFTEGGRYRSRYIGKAPPPDQVGS
jgi:hypothetical protein